MDKETQEYMSCMDIIEQMPEYERTILEDAYLNLGYDDDLYYREDLLEKYNITEQEYHRIKGELIEKLPDPPPEEVVSLLSQFTDREQRILSMLYGVEGYDAMTVEEIAEELMEEMEIMEPRVVAIRKKMKRKFYRRIIQDDRSREL